MESPRFRALLHATSGHYKLHSIDSKGNSRHPPNRKLRGLGSPKENMMVIQSKFKRLKEEIDSELDVFTSDLVEILENTAVEHPEWQVHLENLLVISQTCLEMSLDEFCSKCEEIVQNLDDHRRVLPTGTLKQVHTRILFILTRCTRLVQFQKEGGNVEQDGFHQLSDLGFHSESPYENLKTSMSAKDINDRIIRKRFQENKHLIHDFTHSDVSSCATKIASWKKFEKNQNKVSDEKVDASSDKILDSQQPAHKTISDDDGLETLKLSSKILESSIEQFPKVEEASTDYFTDPNIPTYEKLKMICRICDYEIPTMHAEGHFRVCSIADRCDSNGFTIEDRLDKVAEVLQKILESCMQRVHYAQGMHHQDIKADTSSPEGSNHSSKYQHNSSEVPSSDTMDREIVGYLITNNLNDLPAILGNSHSALSSESMTPESPLMTPKGGQIDLLLSGTKEFANLENFQQIESLLDIVRSIAKIKTCHYSSLEDLSSFLEDLNAVVDTRKVDALVVETFGRRIAKLLQEKFIHLCGQIDDGSKDVASILVNEDGSLRNGLTCIARTSPLGAKLKDRTSIEDFEIIKPISRGAFGRVFLAKKRVTGDLFAIKVLKKADMIRKNAVKSILAERNILISARNPFVVRFYYSFTCKENLYLVMEYLNGGDLYSLLRSLGCLDEEMARIYAAEVVLALEYLHSMNVIHRDLKPDNLLIARDGHVKLTDFGLSKVGLISSTDDLSGPDVSGSVLLSDDEPMPAEQRTIKREQRQKQSAVGTPDYLAPEILLGMQHGPSADWWSVGVILFELLLGIPPFNAEHPQNDQPHSCFELQKIFDNIMNREIPWPRVPEEMSFEAYDLIEKLLITNPAQRLGATGAGEVKCHPFFKSINWGMLAMQKAAFIPSTEGEEDTSYFECRHSWNSEDEQLHASPHEYDYLTDTCSTSYSSSPHSSDPDEQGDECGAMAEFGPNLTINYSFSNFSFKNLSQLASINYDLIMKCSKDSA